MFSIRALNALGYRETLRFVLFACCQWFVVFFVFVVVIGWVDTTEHWARRAFASKVYTNVSALRSLPARSPNTTPSATNQVLSKASFLDYRVYWFLDEAVASGSSVLPLFALVCSLWPVLVVHCAVMFWFYTRIEVLYLFIVYSSSCLHAAMSCSFRALRFSSYCQFRL